MQGADKGQAGRLDGHDLRVGIVQARFNDELTSRMAALCIEELTALGVQAKHIQHVTVPGALEVPVALQAMADSERFDALVHSLEIGKPPRGPGGSGSGGSHGGGRRPRHLH